MNDLQKRLLAVAVPAQEASAADWARNQELVGARRRRRVRGGVVGAVAAAAVVAVAVTWNPLGDPLPAEPAGPAQARVADPGSLQGVADECVQNLNPPEAVTPLVGARSDLARAVFYRFGDGRLQFCTLFDGGSVTSSVPREHPEYGPYVGGVTGGEDSPLVASMLGERLDDYARVVVTTPSGQEYQAVFLDRYWWTPVSLPDETMIDDTTWAAFDHQGRLVDQGRVSTIPAG